MLVRARGLVAWAKVGIGVAMKAGAPLPEIGTVESLTHTLVARSQVRWLEWYLL